MNDRYEYALDEIDRAVRADPEVRALFEKAQGADVALRYEGMPRSIEGGALIYSVFGFCPLKKTDVAMNITMSGKEIGQAASIPDLVAERLRVTKKIFASMSAKHA